jgi:hypothetical protein
MPTPLPPGGSPEPDLDAITRAAVAALVKQRARALSRNPAALDAILPGLSGTGPEAMIEIARRLLDGERQRRQRWFGFGGEVRALNAKAVLLLGRARRLARARGSSADRSVLEAFDPA